MTERSMLTLMDQNALFITLQNRRRISRAAVHKLVKKHLSAAGLDSTQYSAHKLRHTAATLMLQNGVDVRTLQEVLGHDHLNTTTGKSAGKSKTEEVTGENKPGRKNLTLSPSPFSWFPI